MLGKLRGLSSPAAKARHLDAAIAEIRADNIPDELQAAEIAQLQSRKQELG